MFTNNPFEAMVKAMTESLSQFQPAALPDVVEPVRNNVQAWVELAQRQAAQTQAALTETFLSLQNVKDPQAALEAFRNSAEVGLALYANYLKEATELSTEQLYAAVDAVGKSQVPAKK